MAQEDLKQELNDTGLGLGNFLSKSAPAEESSPAIIDKADTKLEAKADMPDDKKADASLRGEKIAKPIDRPSDKAPTDAIKAKAATDPKAAEAVSPDFKANWDDDNNPWKKKAGEFDQRYRDTHRNWQQQHQQNQELQRQLAILGKKFDGTYDPQTDEPPPPDPVAIRTWGAIEGKAQASYAAAVRVHGEQRVMERLEQYAQAFGNDRSVQERILMSDDPIQGAMDALAGYEFFRTYGSDPGKIVETIRQQLETELTPKIAEREAKRVMGELAAKHREPDGLGRVLGSNGATDRQVSKDNAGRPKPLGQITGFGH